ncbi:tRNA intron endonuclease [Obelidium mucronatum]|nr:tRNA intron endonuclease [Obelidium mucronatum]
MKPIVEINLKTLECTVADPEHSRSLYEEGCFGRAMMDDVRIMKRLQHLPGNEKLLERASIRSLSLIETLYLLREGRIIAVISGQEGDAGCGGEVENRLLAVGAKMHGIQAFAARLTVYSLMRKRGWVVRDGIKFGCDYVLYKQGGPKRYHAEYAVQVQWDTQAAKNTWKKLLASIRFTEQAKKALVRVVVDRDRVSPTLFCRWIP